MTAAAPAVPPTATCPSTAGTGAGVSQSLAATTLGDACLSTAPRDADVAALFRGAL
jgi:hypothetical protein